jgi:2-methylcitrate dehydratase PrpD
MSNTLKKHYFKLFPKEMYQQNALELLKRFTTKNESLEKAIQVDKQLAEIEVRFQEWAKNIKPEDYPNDNEIRNGTWY